MELPQGLHLLAGVTPERMRRATLMFSDPPPTALPPVEEIKYPPNPPPAVGPTRYPWENLTFDGGGAKGYAYIGAVQALERAGIYPAQVRRVAGTSVGSILAMFAALGATGRLRPVAWAAAIVGVTITSALIAIAYWIALK